MSIFHANFFQRSGLITGRRLSVVSLLLMFGGLLAAKPAQAHHPFGGEIPNTVVAGFMSGLGHPVIGLDHFVFVIAVGLLAVLQPRGMMIPVAFVMTSLIGTGIHLMGMDVPAPELMISSSVVLVGVLLAMKNPLNAVVAVGLSAIAGVFHGYAYGEAIVGAEMTPLFAYLAGFSFIQLAISLSAYFLGKRVLERGGQLLPLRFAGFSICGIGITLLNTVILG